MNGDFGSGTVGPGWSLFGNINGGVTAGVFEFNKLGQRAVGRDPAADEPGRGRANELVTATFQLGNMQRRAQARHGDPARQRLLATCRRARSGSRRDRRWRRTPTARYATEAWANATFSVYPATVGAEQSIRLDNVTLKRTPSAVIGGTQCLEPASPITALGTRARAKATAPKASTSTEGVGESRTPAGAARTSGAPPAGVWQGWVAAASDARVHVLERGPIDLRSAADARLHVESWLRSAASRATIQVSADGGLTWDTVHTVAASDGWMRIDIDLSAYTGSVIHIRFVFDGAAPADDAAPDVWRLGTIEMEVRRPMATAGPKLHRS